MQNKLYKCVYSKNFINNQINDVLSINSSKTSNKNDNNTCVKKFDPWKRLYNNYTNSFKMKTISRKIHRYQGDELDFVLSSAYQQNTDSFADKCEIFYQPVTLEDVKKPKQEAPKPISYDNRPSVFDSLSVTHIDKPENMHKQVFDDHPLIIGGITARIHASSIKLMNSSHHSPQTNAGYVRQDRDGNLFQY